MIGPLLRMLVIAVLLAAASTHLRAVELAEPTWDLEAMRGLTALNVVVRLTGETGKARIQRDALEESIQTRLRREGVGLLGERPVAPAQNDAPPE